MVLPRKTYIYLHGSLTVKYQAYCITRDKSALCWSLCEQTLKNVQCSFTVLDFSRYAYCSKSKEVLYFQNTLKYKCSVNNKLYSILQNKYRHLDKYNKKVSYLMKVSLTHVVFLQVESERRHLDIS